MKIWQNIFLIVIIMTYLGCESIFLTDDPDSTNIRDFEMVWNRYNQVYPMFDYKNIDWDSIYHIYYPLALKAKGDEIYQVIFDMLAELKDGHIALITEGGYPVLTYVPPRMEKDLNAFDLNTVRKYYDEFPKFALNNSIEYIILEENIGYIYISTFRGNNTEYKSAFEQIFNDLKYVNALIFDVRSKIGGGNIKNYINIISEITSVSTSVIYLINWEYDTIRINPGHMLFSEKPIAVLINGTSISAAEGFSGIMSTLPNVTLIGDTTAGLGGILGNDLILESGKRVTVVDGYGAGPNGEMVEWCGIPPDIRIEQSENDIKQGRDKQLGFAIEFLKQNNLFNRTYR